MEKGLQNEKIDACAFEQADLLGDKIASFAEALHPFTLDQLSAGHTSCDERFSTGDFSRDAHGGAIDRLSLRTIPCTVQFLSGAKKGKRLKHLRARAKKFAVQLAKGVRIFEGNFRCKLAAPFARADPFATGTTVHISAALQFDQVAAVPENDAFFEQLINGFHGDLASAWEPSAF